MKMNRAVLALCLGAAVAAAAADKGKVRDKDHPVPAPSPSAAPPTRSSSRPSDAGYMTFRHRSASPSSPRGTRALPLCGAV